MMSRHLHTQLRSHIALGAHICSQQGGVRHMLGPYRSLDHCWVGKVGEEPEKEKEKKRGIQKLINQNTAR